MRATTKPLAMTEAEREIVRLFLRELRHANATHEQLLVHVDPYTACDGANLFFTYNLPGLSYAVDGRIGRQLRPTAAARISRAARKK